MKKSLLLFPLLLAVHAVPASAWWMTTYRCEEFRYRTVVEQPFLFEGTPSHDRLATSGTLRTWTVHRRYNGSTYDIDTGRGRMATCVHQGTACKSVNGISVCF